MRRRRIHVCCILLAFFAKSLLQLTLHFCTRCLRGEGREGGGRVGVRERTLTNVYQ
jgi:hypothetical protein